MWNLNQRLHLKEFALRYGLIIYLLLEIKLKIYKFNYPILFNNEFLVIKNFILEDIF